MTRPRIHAIVARDASFAVVFRRGPSKAVALLGWDLTTDEVTLGQWFKGRVYAYRSDLSPDGKHLIYFAMDGRWQGAIKGSWTAVSRAPWFTALHIYPWGDCWNGGGLFFDNKTYWLNRGGGRDVELLSVASNLSEAPADPDAPASGMGECPLIYFPRLERDGWRLEAQHKEGGVDIWEFAKPLRKGWTLIKRFRAGLSAGPNGEVYSETHRVTGPGGELPLDGAEWADAWGPNLLFASGGALWRRRIHAKSADEPVLVRDLTDMTFEERTAPYTGVQRTHP